MHDYALLFAVRAAYFSCCELTRRKKVKVSQMPQEIIASAPTVDASNAESSSSQPPERVRKSHGPALLVTFQAHLQTAGEMLEALREDARQAVNEPGAITFELYRSNSDPTVFFLFERWRDEEAMTAHLEQPHTRRVLDLAPKALTTPMTMQRLDDLSPLPESMLRSARREVGEVALMVVFEVKPEGCDAFERQFAVSIAHSRPEQGNLAFHLHRIPTQPRAYVLYERWANQAALDFHFAQPYTRELFTLFDRVLVKPVAQSIVFVTRLD
jgi:quinol monooxygenase YgiN